MAQLTLFLIFTVTFVDLLIPRAVYSDYTQPTPLSVQEGHPVQLNIQAPLIPQFYKFVWKRDNGDIVVSYSNGSRDEYINSGFKGRVDFNHTSLSLTIKNTWRNDSGIYEAIAREGKTDQIGLYNISVVGAVSHGSTITSISFSWITFLLIWML